MSPPGRRSQAANRTLAEICSNRRSQQSGPRTNAKRAKLRKRRTDSPVRSHVHSPGTFQTCVNQRIPNPAEAFTSEERTYLIDQREEYWFTKVRSQAKVVIHDPTLQSCDISKYIGDAKPQH
jgi:hypothetical protein